jgi:hypothetical protein
VKGLDDHYQLTQQTNPLPSPPGLKLLMGKKTKKTTNKLECIISEEKKGQ